MNCEETELSKNILAQAIARQLFHEIKYLSHGESFHRRAAAQNIIALVVDAKTLGVLERVNGIMIQQLEGVLEDAVSEVEDQGWEPYTSKFNEAQNMLLEF